MAHFNQTAAAVGWLENTSKIRIYPTNIEKKRSSCVTIVINLAMEANQTRNHEKSDKAVQPTNNSIKTH
ncbi:hypothetical protein DERF_013211 [Dermatophagoides farinae]|uniref:Uncharacterized protein n=1 Tax=Dermatophagoides farinae TaxID=6954 RepID=A0A922L237_DERFA|nr:hypothetical protein DERF_013211 [Dermatophagoides farinae]